MNRRRFVKHFFLGLLLSSCGTLFTAKQMFAQSTKRIKTWSASEGKYVMTDKVIKSDQEWKKQLSHEQYRVTRKHGTETAFTGPYDKHYKKGIYQCVCCGQDLFDSDHKYDSGTGWPSFFQPIATENIGISKDSSWLMVRNEVHCSRCEAHLGHVFEDGPEPTGLRYCINSVSLNFVGHSS